MIKTFLATAMATLLMDFVWIGLVMNRFYQNQIGSLLRLKEDGGLNPILWAAALVYVCIPLGVILFVLPKAESGEGLLSILPWGFVFGILLYGTYDLTNYSLLKDWTLTVAAVDIVWGGIICAVASMVALKVSRM